jgi:hypothetical protein
MESFMDNGRLDALIAELRGKALADSNSGSR